MTGITSNNLDQRVAATYPSKDKATQAKVILTRKLGLNEKSIKIIEPQDDATGEKLEGSSKSVGRKMLSLHLVYPLVGLIIGMIIAFLLVSYGPLFTQNSPMFTYVALISPGIFIGVFVAGLRSLKPEHDGVNMTTVNAKQNNRWTLLVKTNNANVTKDELCEEIKQTQGVLNI